MLLVVLLCLPGVGGGATQLVATILRALMTLASNFRSNGLGAKLPLSHHTLCLSG